jgi:hypothetical protein
MCGSVAPGSATGTELTEPTEPVVLGVGAAGASLATTAGGFASAPGVEVPGRTGAVCAWAPAAVGVPAPACITVATAVTAPMPAAPPSSVSAALRIGPGFLCRVATRAHLPICAAAAPDERI